MRPAGNLAGIEFLAPPLFHHAFDEWREIISESGYFFTKGAGRWFGSKVSWDSLTKIDAETYGFVTSEQCDFGAWDGQRRYTVRKWTKEHGVNALSEYGQFDNLKEARTWLTRGGFTE